MQATLDAPQTHKFRGSIPENYDSLLGDVFFRPYATDLINRIPPLPPRNAKVLEIACGTGALTNLLRKALPPGVHLVASDVSDSMLDHAQELLGPNLDIEWRVEDATNLSFPDRYFEAVICQFGTMFFDDKKRAFDEINRVLVHGGKFIFNVWDSIECNDLAAIAKKTVGSFFDGHDAPGFYDVPFGFHNHDQIRSLLHHSGFVSVEVATVNKLCEAATALQAARGLIEGTPMILALEEKGVSDPTPMIEKLRDEIASLYGGEPVKCRMQAIVCRAQKR